MSFSFFIPEAKNVRRLCEIKSADKFRRLIGFHLKTNETTRTSHLTTFYLVEKANIIPIALLSVARKNPSGFEVLLGRASGVPSAFAQQFEISERGVDIPPGLALSLWATHVTGLLDIELLWC